LKSSISKDKYYHLFTGSSLLVIALVSELDKEGIIPVVKDQGESVRLRFWNYNSPIAGCVSS
jgi:hypothetical protein